MKKRPNAMREIFLASCALVLVISSTVFAQSDLARHFGSKPVTIIVGSAPGGGYDTFARIVARFVGPHLPGNPTFIVQNMPGAGQLRGLRASMKARPDGLTIGLLHPRFVQRELTGIDVPDFDLKTVRVIGSPSFVKVPRLWCARSSIAKTWADVEKVGRKLSNGGNAPGAAFGIGPQFVSMLGGPIKMVYGYGGTSEIMAAFDRSEIESLDRCTEENVPRLFPQWIKNKTIAPIFWWEEKPKQDYLAQLGVKDLPYILDVVKGNTDQRSAFEVAVQFNVFNRIFVAPPKVSDAAYDAWRNAFEKTTKDPGFLKAAAAAGLEVGLGSAEEFRKSLAAYEKLTPAGVKIFKELIGPTS